MRASDGVVVLGHDEVSAGGAAIRALVKAGVVGDGEAGGERRVGGEGACSEESGEVGEVVVDLELGGFDEGGGGRVVLGRW